jgi:putative tryptophan/tyrosine transport system substrate-binding protein
MRRRDFIAGLGGAAALPFAVRSQQAMPTIGYLSAGARQTDSRTVDSLRQGLKEQGFVEGQNVAIEYRWAEGRYDSLRALAADLVQRKVAVIFAPASTPAALAAKATTTTIPIVFTVGSDPVAAGLVASLSRPGGNVTGVSILINLLSAKRLELLRNLVPGAGAVAVLINPSSSNAWPDLKETEAAAKALRLDIAVVKASTVAEIDAVFADLAQQKAAAVFVIADGFFRNRRDQFVALAANHAIPASYPWPEFAAAGGLMSYGANNGDALRQGGMYVGRILRGEKPADLPVVQATKIELIINQKTARALRLEIPNTLLATADEVIE